MSWKRLKAFARTLGFRLNLWYAADFHRQFGRSSSRYSTSCSGKRLTKKDREVIEARLGEYVAVYENGGVPALQTWVAARQRSTQTAHASSCACPDRQRTDLLLIIPQDWLPADVVSRLDTRGSTPPTRRPGCASPATRRWTSRSRPLSCPTGRSFQVGRSSDSRGQIARTLSGWCSRSLIRAGAGCSGCFGGVLLMRRLTRPIRRLVTAGARHHRHRRHERPRSHPPCRRRIGRPHRPLQPHARRQRGVSSAPCANPSTTSRTTCARRSPGCARAVEDALSHSPAATDEASGVLADALEETEPRRNDHPHAHGRGSG